MGRNASGDRVVALVLFVWVEFHHHALVIFWQEPER